MCVFECYLFYHCLSGDFLCLNSVQDSVVCLENSGFVCAVHNAGMKIRLHFYSMFQCDETLTEEQY